MPARPQPPVRTQAWPTAMLEHLPVLASSLNQIEVAFSVIQRKVVKPANSTDRGPGPAA